MTFSSIYIIPLSLNQCPSAFHPHHQFPHISTYTHIASIYLSMSNALNLKLCKHIHRMSKGNKRVNIYKSPYRAWEEVYITLQHWLNLIVITAVAFDHFLCSFVLLFCTLYPSLYLPFHAFFNVTLKKKKIFALMRSALQFFLRLQKNKKMERNAQIIFTVHWTCSLLYATYIYFYLNLLLTIFVLAMHARFTLLLLKCKFTRAV